MKGKVLGFDPASGTGAINGDDGKRYKFAAADNKSPAPLKPNDTVDFEAADGENAKEIYAVKTGFAMPTGLGAGLGAGSGDAAGGTPVAGGEYVQMILGKPYVIWAAVIILGSLIAGYFGTLSAFDAMNGGPMGGGLGISAIFIVLLIAIPIIAAVLIFFEFTNNPMTAQFRLITAAVAIGGPILLPILAGLTAPEMYKSIREMGSAFGGGGRMGILEFMGFGISPGMVITVAGGVLIILTNMGIVKLPKG